MTEWRSVNEETGGEKGMKSARTDLLPPRALLEIAEQFGHGASKYADRNWERGYEWSKSYAALMRHLLAWWAGEDLDEEGRPHLAAAGFHVLALIEFTFTHPEMDNRPSSADTRALYEWLLNAAKERIQEKARPMPQSNVMDCAEVHQPTLWPQDPRYSDRMHFSVQQ